MAERSERRAAGVAKGAQGPSRGYVAVPTDAEPGVSVKEQRSRANQGVDDATVAKYTAAKGFLFAEWLGALLMLFSFLQFYFVGLRPGGSVRVAWALGLVLLVLGSWMFWTNRRYYLGLEFPFRRPWEIAAMLVAGTAAVFWFMVLLATWLAWRGIAAF